MSSNFPHEDKVSKDDQEGQSYWNKGIFRRDQCTESACPLGLRSQTPSMFAGTGIARRPEWLKAKGTPKWEEGAHEGVNTSK